MSVIVLLCPKQLPGSRVVNGGDIQTSRGGDDLFTTITTTVVTTVGTSVPARRTTPTPTPTFRILCPPQTSIPLTLPTSSLSTETINQPSSSDVLTSHSQPISSTSLPSTAETNFGASDGLQSSSIIAIVIVIIIVVFILAAYIAWRKRRQRRGDLETVSQAGVQPSLPKFSFETEDDSVGGDVASVAFMDKFSRLNKVHSPGVKWVAGDHDTTSQTMKPKVSFEENTSFGPPPSKATVVNTFITDLSDELPVAVGQKLNVMAEYDDGWTFCINEKGEQGMVPVECLYREREEV